jgi:sn-glycerol 3-phosphate transport system substrate-binding protein
MTAALAAGGLTACGADKDPGEIKVWVAFIDYRKQWVKDVAKDFEKKHPEYHIKVTGFETYEDEWKALTAANKEGNPPTIIQNFEAATTESRDQVNSDGKPLFANLQKALDGRKKVLGEPVVIDDVVPAAKNYYSVDGKYTSMPWNTSTPLFYSNMDYLKKAGISSAPTTWEEVKSDCDKIKKMKNGPKKCATWADHAWYPEQMLSEQGGLLTNNKNGRDGRATKVDINTAAYKKFPKFWKKLNDDGEFYYTGKQEDFLAPVDTFNAQKTAFLLSSSGDASNVISETKKAGAKVDVTMMPSFKGTKNHGNVIGGATLWLTDGLEKKTTDGALAFMQFIDNPTNAADWHKKTGYIPITKAAYDKLDNEGWFKKNPYQKLANEQLDRSESSPATLGALVGNFVSIRQQVTQAMEDIITSGANVDSSFAKAQKKSQKLLDDYNKLYAK